jgi:hexosaminidase
MTPGQPVYFDHSQSENEDSITIGGYNPLDRVYRYDPVPQALTGEFEKYVLGTQANVWTEYMTNPSKIQYMIFPRIAALSEICWTVPAQKSWSGFEKRLPTFFERYKAWGVQTSSAYFDIAASVRAQPGNTGIELALTTKAPGTTLQWIQSNTTLPYQNPIKIDKSGVVRAESKETLTGTIKSRYEQLFQIHKASGKKISLVTPASGSYPGDGAITLVNGIKANKGFSRTRDYLGFSGSDAEALIDLGEQTNVNKVEVSFLQRTSSWIYPPSAVEVFFSDDGNQFIPASSTRIEKTDYLNEKMDSKELKTNGKCRYIKVLIKNYGVIPAGVAGAGKSAWLFIDEISVY